MTTGVGVLGFGFMGRTHLRAYRAAERDGFPCRVVAVGSLADGGSVPGPAGNLDVGGEADLAGVQRVSSAEELAADPRIQLVSICTPTDLHARHAEMMLESQKHVLIEKPVALEADQARRLGEIAREHGRLCMAAMCMRWWPGWDWLKTRVEDGSLGAAQSASFTRLGSRPGWSPAFYRDPARCGGAIFDLHLHDVDIIHWLFGMPDEVSSVGTIDHVTTIYRYKHGPAHVAAEGGWVETPGFPFRMRYTVEFELAVADWDLTRPERLLLTQGGETAPVPIPQGAGYDGEVRAVLRAIGAGARAADPGMEDAAAVIGMIHAERESLRTRRPVSPGR
jgi:predicted dehydrogenase